MTKTNQRQSRRIDTRTALAASTGACVLLAASAQAAVLSGELTGGSAFDDGGSFLVIAAPAVLGNNQYEDNNVRAFDEVQDLVLTEDLIMDFRVPAFPSNVVAAGSVVSSHYLYFDPENRKDAIGSVSFDEPVIGIITTNLRFNNSDDVLGNPATDYAIGSQELDNNDTVTIAGNTVSWNIDANSPGDAIRIITSSNAESGINVCDIADTTLTGVITGGDALANGGEFLQICAPIGDVGNNNFDSYDLFAFEEQQAVELVADLFLDDTTVVPAGEFVSSFYVIWDPVPTNNVQATITFPDTVIGVISDRQQLEDSEFLGDASANYLNPNDLGLENNDDFTIDGNTVSIDFNAGSPGDSIRVILGSASPSLSYNICEPQDMTLSGTVTGGTAAADGGVFAQLCEPIGPVGNNNQQANDLFAFEESINVTLAEVIELDDPPLATIAAGTIVSSYYVAFDPASNKDIIGSITFPGDILGLATSVNTLISSDGLGNPTASYLNPSQRGLEGDDFASFAGFTVSVDFTASSPGDYIRVFVGVVDSDSDGITDDMDNCILVANADQLDTNGDGIGNACDPDLNNDCVINFTDLGELKAVFFSSDADADFTGDNVVNFSDLAVIKAFFFSAPGPAAEPNDCT